MALNRDHDGLKCWPWFGAWKQVKIYCISRDCVRAWIRSSDDNSDVQTVISKLVMWDGHYKSISWKYEVCVSIHVYLQYIIIINKEQIYEVDQEKSA